MRAMRSPTAYGSPITRAAARTAARAALWLTPFVALAAVLTAAFWLARSGPDAALMNGLAVLVIACPCALGFATPLALWAAMARFALRGAWLRNGDALERLATADLVLFDKTGTLTAAEPRLAAFVTVPDPPISGQELLAAIAAAEQLSGHPIAAAFRGLMPPAAPPFEIVDLRLLPGQGISANLRDPRSGLARDLRIGLAEKLLPEQDAALWRSLLEQARPSPGARLLTVLLDHRLAALAALEERPLPGVQALWATLEKAGLDSILVSGDAEDRVRALGHPDARASMQPLEKLELVRALRAQGRHVLYVGDGINDAAAMAEAHVALAVESGAPLARDLAHGILRPDAVTRLPELIRIARQARRLARSNLVYAAAYNVTGIAAAAAGWLHPVLSALVMTCSSLMVVWRAAAFLSPDLEQQSP
ncbi:MAG: HAD-IC family P-type ATPase [Bryobacteraceae bacterium]